MSTQALYSRPIRVTTSGYALERPTKVSGITIVATSQDTNINLRDGGPAGTIVWSGEADNTSSSFSKTFNPPLRFFHKIYVDYDGSPNDSCTLEVIEP